MSCLPPILTGTTEVWGNPLSKRHTDILGEVESYEHMLARLTNGEEASIRCFLHIRDRRKHEQSNFKL